MEGVFPTPNVTPPEVLLGTHGIRGLGSELAIIGVAPADAAWPNANRAVFSPIYLDATALLLKLWWENGTVVSGNVDVGLYRADSTPVVRAGSTAQAGTSVLQEKDVADIIVLGPAVYYVSMAMDNTTGRVFRTAPGSNNVRELGMALQDTAFPLPSPAVFAAAANFLPVCGIAFRTLVA